LKHIIRLFFGTVLILLAGRVLNAQGQPTATGSCSIIASAGTCPNIVNTTGTTQVSFEEIPVGTGFSGVSVTVQGCMRGGTCDTAANTNTSTSAIIEGVSFTKVYNYFLVTATYTGGTSFTINWQLSASGGGGGGGSGGNVSITQPVDGSGYVEINCKTGCAGSNPNGQATMANSAPVVIASNQSAIGVTGTFWQTTQPVSGTFWQTTQPVSGTVAATQSGTWNVTNAGTFAVQAAQSGTWTSTVTQATASNLNATVVGTGTFATQASQAGSWNVGLTGSLPAGSNTIGAVTQASGPWTQNLTQLASTNLGAPSAYGTSPGAVEVAGVNAFVTNQNANGQALMAASAPVVIASNQSALPVSQSGTWNVAINGPLDGSGYIEINCKTGCTSNGGSSITDEGAYTQGTTSFTVAGGFYATSVTPLTSGQAGAFQSTVDRALFVNNYKWAGTALGAPSNYGTSPGAVAVPGVNAYITNTPAVSGSGIFQVSPTSSANGATNQFFTAITDGTNAMGAMSNFGTSPSTVKSLNVNASMFMGSTALSATNPFFANITDGTHALSAAVSAWGTAPTGTEVMGVNSNLFVAGTPAATATSGVQKVGIVGNSGNTLDVGAGAAAATNSLQAGGVYNSSAPSPSTGQQEPLQLTSAANLKTDQSSVGGTAVTAATAYGTAPSGNVAGVNAFVTNVNANGQASAANSAPVVLATPPATILAGQQAVTATGTALASNALTHGLCVQALSTNSISVFVGPSGVTTSTGIELPAKSSYCIGVANSNAIYVVASTTGASVTWSGN
jgi:hypothetical protein